MNKPAESNAETKAKIVSLFGSTQLMVDHEDGTKETIRVRQLRMNEYQKASAYSSDEMAITAFCCSLEATPDVPCSVEWIMTLHPKSYEVVQAKVREVNAEGFFPYAARRQDLETKSNQQWIRLAAELPPEALAAVTKIGLSASPTSLPKPR